MESNEAHDLPGPVCTYMFLKKIIDIPPSPSRADRIILKTYLKKKEICWLTYTGLFKYLPDLIEQIIAT